jgi:hypothetical protein
MSNEPTPYLPVNHVFVDLENVKSIDVTVVGGKNLTFHLFLGPQNKKLDVTVVEALLDNAQAVKLIRSPKAGKNALDFVLAYHLGQAVLADPKGYFHIISKDGGFDSLVGLLESKRVKVKRHADWSGLHFNSPPKNPAPAVPSPPAPATKTLSAGAAKVLENLRKTEKNRPKRIKTLVSHAVNSLGKGATTDKGEMVVEELRQSGHLVIDDKGSVAYKP